MSCRFLQKEKFTACKNNSLYFLKTSSERVAGFFEKKYAACKNNSLYFLKKSAYCIATFGLRRPGRFATWDVHPPVCPLFSVTPKGIPMQPYDLHLVANRPPI